MAGIVPGPAAAAASAAMAAAAAVGGEREEAGVAIREDKDESQFFQALDGIQGIVNNATCCPNSSLASMSRVTNPTGVVLLIAAIALTFFKNYEGWTAGCCTIGMLLLFPAMKLSVSYGEISKRIDELTQLRQASVRLEEAAREVVGASDQLKKGVEIIDSSAATIGVAAAEITGSSSALASAVESWKTQNDALTKEVGALGQTSKKMTDAAVRLDEGSKTHESLVEMLADKDKCIQKLKKDLEESQDLAARLADAVKVQEGAIEALRKKRGS